MNFLILLATAVGLFTPTQVVAEVKPIIVLEAQLIPLVSVETKIREKAKEYGYPEEKALAIARAESDLNPQARNKTSSAKGVFQFIDSTWNYYCKGEVLNEDDNINCAVRMLSEGGESHWNASRHIWE